MSDVNTKLDSELPPIPDHKLTTEQKNQRTTERFKKVCEEIVDITGGSDTPLDKDKTLSLAVEFFSLINELMVINHQSGLSSDQDIKLLVNGEEVDFNNFINFNHTRGRTENALIKAVQEGDYHLLKETMKSENRGVWQMEGLKEGIDKIINLLPNKGLPTRLPRPGWQGGGFPDGLYKEDIKVKIFDN